MEKRLKSWQGWLLFGGSMVVVFVLGLCVSALMERRAELASVFNNRKTVIEGIEARNEVFKSDFPREYQTWTETAKTDFQTCHCYGWPAAFYLLDLQEPRCAPHDGSYRCGCFL